jgi:hypothetical protein
MICAFGFPSRPRSGSLPSTSSDDNTMEVQKDFKELLESLNANRVEYVIVGAYALAFHGAPRFTGDLDILVNPAPENARRVLAALQAFGFESVGLTIGDFTTADRVTQLGVPPVRVDILTSISGVSWKSVDAGKVASAYGGVPVSFIGRAELVANKRAAGRARDLADLEALGEK